MIDVLCPVAPPPSQTTSSWQPLKDLRAARVVIVNNHWTSMDQLARMLTERLLTEYQVASVTQVGLPTSAAPPRGLLEGAAEGADLAIVGLAN
jgi:hypothetical protein